ncbi:MAG: hypothetical protein JSS66_05155 [Armatimonadetes bacterium]|nr:hypothetical protein [Armatimonadota bacterium]
MGANEAAQLRPGEDDTSAEFLNAWDAQKKKLDDPAEDPYQQTMEKRLESFHHETRNVVDPNSDKQDALWRGLDVKKQSDAEIPQSSNWPASLDRVRV